VAVADLPVVSHAQTALDRYGMGGLFAANVLGAGSVYILAQTGASTGFALLWVLPLAFALDMVLHDLSSRLAAEGRPLMVYIRSVLGPRWAPVYALTMALVMQLWAVANYAVAGAALAWLTGLPVVPCIILSAGVAITLIVTQRYPTVEAAIATLLLVVFGAYVALAAGVSPPRSAVLAGFNPFAGVTSATLVIAMLGTTVYYPNFFIQSSMRPTKGWTELAHYRRDNAVGVAASVLVSAAMLTVAAMTLPPGELALADPAVPLRAALGTWAEPLFMLAVFAAAFTSATGTLFGSSFAVPQAFGRRTEFGDPAFVGVTVALIVLSTTLALAALAFTNLTPVRMAIVMPALNGALFLPATLAALYGATNHQLSPPLKALALLAFLVLAAGSVLTAQDLLHTIETFLYS